MALRLCFFFHPRSSWLIKGDGIKWLWLLLLFLYLFRFSELVWNIQRNAADLL